MTLVLKQLVASSDAKQKAQYDPRSAILVDGMESRACLSTILSYTCSYEDAQALARRLCKKGAEFVEKDESDLLKTLCVPKDKIKKQKPPSDIHQSKIV